MAARRTLLLAATALVAVGGAHALAQAEAERRVDAALARVRAALPPGGALAWRDRSVDPVSGAVRLTGLTFREGPREFTAEEVTLRGVDETRAEGATFRAVRITDSAPRDRAAPTVPPGAQTRKAPVAAPGAAAGPRVLTVAQVTIANLSVPAPGGAAPGRPAPIDWSNASLGNAMFEGFRMAEAGEGVAELGRLSLSDYAPGRVGEAVLEGLRYAEDPAKGQGRMTLGRVRLAGAAVPRIGAPVDPWALAADAMLVEGVDLNLPDQRITMRLGRFEAEGYGPGRTTRAAVGGLAMSGPAKDLPGDLDIRLGSLSFSGVALYDSVRAVVDGGSPPQPPPGQAVRGEAEGFTVAMANQPVFTMARMRMEAGAAPADPAEQFGTLALEGLSVNLPPDAGGAWLTRLGYGAVAGRIEIASRANETARTLSADPFAIVLDGMGRLDVTMDVRNWQQRPPGTSLGDAAAAMAAMADWQIAAFTIRYTDMGFLPRLYAQQAREGRVPEARLREQYARMAMEMPVPEGKDAGALRQMRQALATFARSPGTLELAMRPPQPLSFGTMMGASSAPSGDLIGQFGLSVRATPGATPTPAPTLAPQPPQARPAPTPPAAVGGAKPPPR